MALLGLIGLGWLLLIIALVVKIKVPGQPVLFRQQRVGRHGKLFTMHKFRTMYGEQNGPSVAYPVEGRVTPIGAKLRRYKLDELPELWDVLVGTMSFVGPRPDVPGYADALVGDDQEVLELRPGITGPATLKYRLEDEMLADVRRKMEEGRWKMEEGRCLPQEQMDKMTDQELAIWYNDHVIYPDKVRINRYYLHHYSFIKDIQMLFCTVLGKKMKYAGEVI